VIVIRSHKLQTTSLSRGESEALFSSCLLPAKVSQLKSNSSSSLGLWPPVG